ncbi:MAG: STAS domain-containing protein [Actinobacteria bacterium]|nr:STAS domain-containing protein [Actinomycetota bacterium]
MDDDGQVTIRLDLRGLPPDAATIGALARLQLVARGIGCRVELLHASPELVDLAEFMGLARVLVGWRLPLEVVGQAEQREQASGVEEEGELDDPSL